MFKGERSRHLVTMEYVRLYIPPGASILDLGGGSPMADMMRRHGLSVANTRFDLDLHPGDMWDYQHRNWTTAFEVFEHLCNLYGVLTNIPTTKLLCSVPLNVWFSPPHWLDDPYKQHYHEFYPCQFKKILEKTGWEINLMEKRRIVKSIGLRQMLRIIWPSYLFVVATRVKGG